ncbi:MAG: adenylyltransferase/cytidyltransferase family protein [Lentisphaerae bacterium]|nr:adenylyltransferase/cytidyltransferase family protein [Lentisphaerota bacterium]
MKKVFVSGCYDILHGGHIEFFNQAKALGDYLIICLPGDESLFLHKRRRPFIPLEHKVHLTSSLKMVDEVVIGNDLEIGLNFRSEFMRIKPQILAVTEDDKFAQAKKKLCAEVGAEYVRLPKNLSYQQISTTEIFQRLHAPPEAPVRIDFAGGWLDVPRFARPDSYIINCAISPLVSLYNWGYETCSGLGGSGAYALLTAKDGIKTELGNDVGWQDPAIIQETGLCVWRSGKLPVLDFKTNPDFLRGKMAIYWTGKPHVTRNLANLARDYDLLIEGSKIGRVAALTSDYNKLCEAVRITYKVQLKEGMKELPTFGEKAKKYCGGGHGGYAVYLFDERPYHKDLIHVEPYMKSFFG